MIDFDVDWSRWFDGIEQPDANKTKKARTEANLAMKGANDIENYLEDGGERALADFVRDVEEVVDLLKDSQEETEARFKDAEFAAEQAREGFAWFLNHHRAVLITNRVWKSDSNENRPPEIVSWCDNNCKGDYQTFDVERDVAIVFFDETDRLHCKMRFG